MIFVDEMRKQLDVMLHPGSMIKKGMSFGGALRYYYKVVAIPMVVYIVLALILGSTGMLHNTGLLGPASGSLYIVGTGILLFVVLEPIGLFVDTAIFQFFGKYVFRKYKQGSNITFTAVTYAALASMLLYWLSLIPGAGLVIAIVLSIWSLVVLVIGLSKLQKISGKASLGVFIGSTVITIVIVMVVVLLAFSVASAAVHP